jgi:hypothetical protein
MRDQFYQPESCGPLACDVQTMRRSDRSKAKDWRKQARPESIRPQVRGQSPFRQASTSSAGALSRATSWSSTTAGQICTMRLAVSAHATPATQILDLLSFVVPAFSTKTTALTSIYVGNLDCHRALGRSVRFGSRGADANRSILAFNKAAFCADQAHIVRHSGLA